MIRAYDPRPGAFAMHGDLPVKLFGGRATTSVSVAPGTVLVIDENGMGIACGENAVQINTVQPSGKRRQTPLDWANGRGIAVGERLS